MQIIFIQHTYYPDKKATELINYVRQLKKNDDITVICANENQEKIEARNNEKIHRIDVSDKHTLINTLIFVKSSLRILKQIKVTDKKAIIHNIQPSPSIAILVILQRIFFRNKYRIVYDIRTGPIGKSLISFIGRWQTIIASFFADSLCIINKHLIKVIFPKILINKTEKISKMHVVSAGVDLDLFNSKQADLLREAYNINKNHLIFLYVGTLDKRRNLEKIARAFMHFNKKASLIFIGQGSGKNDLEQIIQKNNIDNIFIHDPIPFNKVSDYINSADVCLAYIPMASYFEHQPPLKSIEYLACDKPTIITKTKANLDLTIFFNQEMNHLVINDDIREIEKAMEYAVDNYSQLNQCNWFKIAKKYNWSLIVKKSIIPLYKELY